MNTLPNIIQSATKKPGKNVDCVVRAGQLPDILMGTGRVRKEVFPAIVQSVKSEMKQEHKEFAFSEKHQSRFGNSSTGGNKAVPKRVVYGQIVVKRHTRPGALRTPCL